MFSWASLHAERLSLDYDAELLFVGAMFHDVGLLEGHRSQDERFEIDGANAPRAFLERHGMPEDQVMTVWQSIALHTTRQVPSYLRSEVRLVSLGVQYDVLGSPFDTLTAEQRDSVLAAHPRTNFKTGIDAERPTSRRAAPLASILYVRGEDPPYVMAQLGHTDPGFTLRVYAHAMRRDEGDKEQLKALLEGRDWAPMGTERPHERLEHPLGAAPENDESPANAGLSADGRGWFRTSDLSRVKAEQAPPPTAHRPRFRAAACHRRGRPALRRHPMFPAAFPCVRAAARAADRRSAPGRWPA